MRLVSRIFFCYVEEIDAKGKNAWRSLAERHLAFLGQTVLRRTAPTNRNATQAFLKGWTISAGCACEIVREQTVSFPGAFGWTALPCSRDAKRHARRGNGLPQRCGGGSQVSPMPFRGAS